jgi:hypothetical protein
MVKSVITFRYRSLLCRTRGIRGSVRPSLERFASTQLHEFVPAEGKYVPTAFLAEHFRFPLSRKQKSFHQWSIAAMPMDARLGARSENRHRLALESRT